MTGVTVPLVASVSSTRRAAASAVRRIVQYRTSAPHTMRVPSAGVASRS